MVAVEAVATLYYPGNVKIGPVVVGKLGALKEMNNEFRKISPFMKLLRRILLIPNDYIDGLRGSSLPQGAFNRFGNAKTVLKPARKRN